MISGLTFGTVAACGPDPHVLVREITFAPGEEHVA